MSSHPHDEAVFSRSGRTSPGGKMTRRLDIPCTEATEEAVIAFAYLSRKPKAEVAREALDLGLEIMRHMNDRFSQNPLSGRCDESSDHSTI